MNKKQGAGSKIVCPQKKEKIIYIPIRPLDKFFAIIKIEGYEWKEIKLCLKTTV